MLIFLQQQGMINLDDVRNKMKETERQRLLSQHNYKIFHDTDGRWKTTLVDPSKKTGRRLIAKTHLHDLEDVIIASYSAVEDEKYIKENIYTLETIFLSGLNIKLHRPTLHLTLDVYWLIGISIIKIRTSHKLHW